MERHEKSARYITVTLPLHYRYITVTLPLHHGYITVTSPLHHRYITVALPLHYRHVTATLPPQVFPPHNDSVFRYIHRFNYITVLITVTLLLH